MGFEIGGYKKVGGTNIIRDMLELETRLARRHDAELLGRISGGCESHFHRIRKLELQAAMLGMRPDLVAFECEEEIEADSSDHFTGRERFADGRHISLDNAAAFDEGNADFAAGFDLTGQLDVLPCDLVGRPRDAKFGRSGVRVWDR